MSKGEAKYNEQGEVVGIKAPIYLNYNFTAGAAAARFLVQVKQGVLTGHPVGNLLLAGSVSYTPTAAGTYYAETRNTTTNNSHTTVCIVF